MIWFGTIQISIILLFVTNIYLNFSSPKQHYITSLIGRILHHMHVQNICFVFCLARNISVTLSYNVLYFVWLQQKEIAENVTNIHVHSLL